MEESRPEASALRTLVEKHRQGTVIVQITAIAAAERQRSGTSLEHFDHFRARIAALGLGKAVFLRPPMYVGLCFADYCLVHGDEFLSQERAIHEVLFSSVPFEIDSSEHPVGSKQWLRWLNAKCDVLTMWCHLHYGGDVFVSSDKTFTLAANASGCSAWGLDRLYVQMRLPKPSWPNQSMEPKPPDLMMSLFAVRPAACGPPRFRRGSSWSR
jgi:hypothetical protein